MFGQNVATDKAFNGVKGFASLSAEGKYKALAYISKLCKGKLARRTNHKPQLKSQYECVGLFEEADLTPYLRADNEAKVMQRIQDYVNKLLKCEKAKSRQELQPKYEYLSLFEGLDNTNADDSNND